MACFSELDFDITDEHGLFSDFSDFANNDSNDGLTKMGSPLFQEMKKAGFTAVDLLREDDLARAESLYEKLTSDHVTKDRKRIRLKDGIPRVMRNDIRWQYSQMFMNTVNCGDFKKMQSFFGTFMTKPCKFIVDHEIDPEFGLPHRLLVNGPKLMAIYLLGVFVIFPDFTMHLKESRLITSRGWVGSKIVMDVEVKSTKLFDIAMDAWVPQVKYLANFKTAGATDQGRISNGESSISDNTSSSDSAGSLGNTAFIERGGSPAIQELLPSAALGRKIVDISGAESTAFISAADVEISRKGRLKHIKTEKEDENTTVSTSLKRKHEPEVEPKTEITAEREGLKTSLPKGNPLLNPDVLIKAIFATAKLKKEPQLLQAHGTITMFLDFHNNIQHLNLKLYEAGTDGNAMSAVENNNT